jgi:twitching motility protein PilT
MAITAAETGHLVLSTLHTVDAVRTIDRIIDVFPTFQQRQVRLQLSANLLGVASQTLLRNARKDRFILASEILVATPAIQNLIRESKTYMIGSMVQTGADESMRTMNRALYELIQKKMVTYEECLARSPNPDELEKLMGKRASLMDSLLQGPST